MSTEITYIPINPTYTVSVESRIIRLEEEMKIVLEYSKLQQKQINILRNTLSETLAVLAKSK